MGSKLCRFLLSQAKVWHGGIFRFVPCEWNDQVCHQAMALGVHEGRMPEALAGYHQYSGSWLSTVRNGKKV